MSEDEPSVICPCPVCGEELAEMDEMWRQIHINGCLTKEQPSMLQRCQVEKCPICGRRLNHLSADLATKHINECIDKKQREEAVDRPTERCRFCGMCLKGLTERQLKLHDQGCRKTDRVVQADVIQYPKVVESLPTPAEWEVHREFKPRFVTPVKRSCSEPVPIFGRTVNVDQLQNFEGYELTNEPYALKVPETDGNVE